MTQRTSHMYNLAETRAEVCLIIHELLLEQFKGTSLGLLQGILDLRLTLLQVHLLSIALGFQDEAQPLRLKLHIFGLDDPPHLRVQGPWMAHQYD